MLLEGQQTLEGDHEILARRRHRLGQALGGRGHLPVEQDLPVSVDATDGAWSGRADRCHRRRRAFRYRIAFAVLRFTHRGVYDEATGWEG